MLEKVAYFTSNVYIIMIALVSQQVSGYSLKQIGEYFKMKDAAVSQSNRRLHVRIGNDKKLMKNLGEIRKALNVEY